MRSFKKILVTGGAGFIGSHVIRYLLNEHSDLSIVNLDALTYAGNLDNLKDVAGCDNYTFVKGNICNKELVEGLFSEHQFDAVIHLAAESHVDRSIENPMAFLETNIMGTAVLLNAALDVWSTSGMEENYSTTFQQMRFMDRWEILVCLLKRQHTIHAVHIARQKHPAITSSEHITTHTDCL